MTAPLASEAELARRHLRFGWWSLLFFLSLGIALELLHGLKVPWYLDVASDTRRLMWTLSHAHGTLIALIHLAFAAGLRLLADAGARVARIASPCLIGAAILLPGGFLLGGVAIHDGDPGVGIYLTPIGALMLFTAVFVTARAASRGREP